MNTAINALNLANEIMSMTLAKVPLTLLTHGKYHKANNYYSNIDSTPPPAGVYIHSEDASIFPCRATLGTLVTMWPPL